MTDLLLQIGISNLCISLALAILAWAVHSTGKRPLVAHLLWLLVLAKLVTPPIVTLRVVPVPGLTATTAERLADHLGLEATSASTLAPYPTGSSAMLDQGADGIGSRVAVAAVVERGKTGLVLLWVFGSACVLAWSLVRVYRFNRLLRMASEVAPPELQRVASEIGQRLGIKSAPTIYTTSARLSPMVWWLGGRVRIVIPAALPDEMNTGQLRWILAHELAHVRRRDHLVRWLEWLACVCFWWNPVAWWARRNLRINEEICCDALVLSSFEPKPKTYASALMTVVEFLASPVIRPPAMASEINSGGFLERRFKMIVSKDPIPKTPRWLVAGVLLMALGLLPLGVAYAGDREAGAKGTPSKAEMAAVKEKIGNAIKAGEITEEQGKARWEAYEASITAEYLKQVWAELQAEVEAGNMPAEEARAKMAAIKKVKHGGDGGGEAIWRRVGGALGEAGIERDKIRLVMGAMGKIVVEVRSEGDGFELNPEMRSHLEKLGLTAEQIELVVGLSQRVAASPAAKGDGGADAIWRRVAGALSEAGIERDKIREVMGAMERIVAEVRSEGDAFALDPEMQAHLEGLGLNGEQIELIVGLSRRVAASPAARGDEGMKRRIAGALGEAGIERDKIREVMGAMRRIMAELKSEGDAFELNPETQAHLEGLGLSGEQIEFVVGLSRRVASRATDDDRGRGDEGMRRRIIGALMENGIARENVESVMGTLRQIIGEIKREGDAFELDPGVREQLEGMNLTDEQIEYVVTLARRLASRRG